MKADHIKRFFNKSIITFDTILAILRHEFY